MTWEIPCVTRLENEGRTQNSFYGMVPSLQEIDMCRETLGRENTRVSRARLREIKSSSLCLPVSASLSVGAEGYFLSEKVTAAS